MSELIEPGLVVLDADLGPDKSDVIRALAGRVATAGRATSAEALAADAWKREQQSSTGLPGGMAIPHCKSPAVTQASLAVARLQPGVEFDEGETADLVFMIAAPEGAAQDHLALLALLARSLMKDDFVASLRSAATPEEVVEIVRGALREDEEAAPAAAAATGAAAAGAAGAAAASATTATADAPAGGRRSIVAVTACPTGIAHTYMAADALKAAAERAGVDYHVETQGSAGATPVPPDVIAAADAVIFAVDVDVRDKARFAGKPVVQVPVKRGIDEADELVATETLGLRKDAMLARSDAFVALPGGFGTLDELVEVISQRQLGMHAKPMVLVDHGGFFQPLLAFFELLRAERLAYDNTVGSYEAVPSVETAVTTLVHHLADPGRG